MTLHNSNLSGKNVALRCCHPFADTGINYLQTQMTGTFCHKRYRMNDFVVNNISTTTMIVVIILKCFSFLPISLVLSLFRADAFFETKC